MVRQVLADRGDEVQAIVRPVPSSCKFSANLEHLWLNPDVCDSCGHCCCNGHADIHCFWTTSMNLVPLA